MININYMYSSRYMTESARYIEHELCSEAANWVDRVRSQHASQRGQFDDATSRRQTGSIESHHNMLHNAVNSKMSLQGSII